MKRLSLAAAALGLALVSPARADATGYAGEVMTVGFGYCPNGWIEARGQLLPINQNQMIFSLFGVQFGGNGQSTFALPDLRGRVTAGQGAAGYDARFPLGWIGPVVDSMAINSKDVPLPPTRHKSQPFLTLRYCVSLSGLYPPRP